MVSRFNGNTVVSRILLYSILWWVLVDGAAGSWSIGAPAVAAAVALSVVLLPPTGLVWRNVVAFVPFFIWHSLQGAMDVGWRVFHPRLPIAPRLVEYPLQLPQGMAQVTLVNVVSLLPGTLSAQLDRRVLKVHVLDGRRDVMPQLQALERRVERLWAIAASDLRQS